MVDGNFFVGIIQAYLGNYYGLNVDVSFFPHPGEFVSTIRARYIGKNGKPKFVGITMSDQSLRAHHDVKELAYHIASEMRNHIFKDIATLDPVTKTPINISCLVPAKWERRIIL